MSLEAMKQALEALEENRPWQASTLLRHAVEQAERQEPVVGPSASDWVHVGDGFYRKRGDTAPPQSQPLTNETLWEMWVESPSDVLQFARIIERAHGITGETQ